MPYTHLVFTLPDDLNPLAAVHDRWLYDTLIACVAATLSEFAHNPRWLGAEPTFTLVLHTLRQTQDRPGPKICAAMSMCSSPAAASTCKATGSNRNATRDFCFRFMPCHGYSGPSSWMPWMPWMPARQAGKLPRDPAATPEVLDYLSRYTHRTAISNERIVAIRNGDVLLRVRADDSGGKRVIRTPDAVFIGRFLQHVLPPGFKRIRHYGLLSPARKRERLTQARQALQVPASSPLALEAAEESFCGGWRKKTSRAALAVNRAPCESWWWSFRRIAPPWCVRIPRCCFAHLPKSIVMATRSFMPSKKWCVLARDILGLNRADPVAKARLRQIDSPIGPLSDFHLLQPKNRN